MGDSTMQEEIIILGEAFEKEALVIVLAVVVDIMTYIMNNIIIYIKYIY